MILPVLGVKQMEVSLWQYAVICPLVGIAGFVDSIAGGGGLISIPAYLLCGIEPHFASGTNKISSGMGTTLATIRYSRNGYIRWPFAIACAAVAVMASVIGARLNLMVDGDVLRVVMLAILPIVAFYVLKKKTFEVSGEELAPRAEFFVGLCIAFAGGMYDGFYGPGTGTFILILLTSIAKMKVTEANGVTKVINLSSNIAALSVMAVNGKIIVPLGIAAGTFNIIGSYIGTSIFKRKGAAVVRPIIAVVITIFIVKLIVELFL